VALVAVAIIVWRVVAGQEAAADDGPPPSALVTLAPVRADAVRETVSAYGVIAGSPASSATLAAPRAVIVERVLAGAGSPVAAGAPLIVLTNAPSSTQAYRQAADGVTFAERDLARVQRLFDQRLAANDQLTAAQKALADARAALSAQSAMGAGSGHQTLTAPFAGVVATAPVAAGEHVAADAPLMTLVAGDGFVAQLGVDPQKAIGLAAGQTVRLIPVFHPERGIDTRLSLVTREIDPTSHMIDVTARAGASLPLGEAVRGEITIASHPGLLAPRAAVVFDEQGAHVFVVSAGKARQVPVKTGAEQGDEIEVVGAVRAGDQLADQGAYQLQDGMAVRVADR
jgi:RND family efflux transporter MFP subunit